jgi:AcrR family transcriptional regulator
MNTMSETLTAAPESTENAVATAPTAGTAPMKRTTLKARPDRRQNILDASQRLFARYGFHAVTIRQIAAEAKVPLALVGYYFGQKQELYDAIFAHWSSTVAQRSIDLSEALTAAKGQQLQRIVSAMVVPVVRMRGSAQGESYALFLTRGLTQQGVEEDRAIREFLDPISAEFISALHGALAHEYPGFTQPQAAWGYQFALGSLLHYLSDQRINRLSHGVNVVGDPAVEKQLVEFIVQGLRGAAKSFSTAA